MSLLRCSAHAPLQFKKVRTKPMLLQRPHLRMSYLQRRLILHVFLSCIRWPSTKQKLSTKKMSRQFLATDSMMYGYVLVLPLTLAECHYWWGFLVFQSALRSCRVIKHVHSSYNHLYYTRWSTCTTFLYGHWQNIGNKNAFPLQPATETSNHGTSYTFIFHDFSHNIRMVP